MKKLVPVLNSNEYRSNKLPEHGHFVSYFLRFSGMTHLLFMKCPNCRLWSSNHAFENKITVKYRYLLYISSQFKSEMLYYDLEPSSNLPSYLL